MKRVIRYARNLGMVFGAVLTLAVAKANDTIKNQGIPVEMKFIGKLDEKPLFQLKLSGDAIHNDYTITVRDEFHEILYRERVRTDQYSKRFLLNSEELGNADLVFEIFCNKTKETVTYRVSQDTKSFQDISIREIAKY